MRQKYLNIERQLEKVKTPKELTKPGEVISNEHIEELQMKIQDLEQSNKVLKRIKNAYKQTSEVKCRGCSKLFKPIIFKAHVLSCQKLFEDHEGFQDIAKSTDIDQIFI